MSARPKHIVPGLYAAYASLVLFLIITAVFVDAPRWAWGAAIAGTAGSGVIGFFSVSRGLATPVTGALHFARPWLWFAVWAAVGLYDGRYRPLLLSAGLAAAVALAYLLGGLGGAWTRRRLI